MHEQLTPPQLLASNPALEAAVMESIYPGVKDLVVAVNNLYKTGVTRQNPLLAIMKIASALEQPQNSECQTSKPDSQIRLNFMRWKAGGMSELQLQDDDLRYVADSMDVRPEDVMPVESNGTVREVWTLFSEVLSDDQQQLIAPLFLQLAKKALHEVEDESLLR